MHYNTIITSFDTKFSSTWRESFSTKYYYRTKRNDNDDLNNFINSKTPKTAQITSRFFSLNTTENRQRWSSSKFAHGSA